MATRAEAGQNLARQIINIIAYVALFAVSVTAVTVPYNNNYLMDVVSRYNPDFMASAYVWYIFSIVEFVFLLCFIIYQGMSKRKNDKVLRSIDAPWYVFVVANIIWTFGFFYDVQWLAFVGTLITAVALFYIYIELGIGKTKVSRCFYWCVHFPFAILAASIIFGVVAQTAMFCIRYNLIWWGIGQTAWTVVAMLVVGFFGSLFMHWRCDVGFGCTMVWFSAGIAVYQNNYDPVVTAFAYLLALYFAIVTYACAMHRPRVNKKGSK